MPNRIIRDWTDSERVDNLSFQAEILLLRLMMKADDLGAYHANPKLINSFCFPLKNIRETDISRWLHELVSAGLIALYDADNKKLLHIINFGQRMRTVKPKFPQIPENELNKIMSATCQQTVDNPPPEEESEYEVEDETEGEGKIPPSFSKSDLPDKIPEAKEEKEKSCAKKEKEVLEYLNQIGGKNFQPVESNLKFIRARLKNHPIDVLKQVIEVKAYEWKDDFKMSHYLRPETIFNSTKFESYAQQVHEIKQNPQKFKNHVEQRNAEVRKSAAKHYDPLDAMPD